MPRAKRQTRAPSKQHSHKSRQNHPTDPAALQHAVQIIHAVCCLAGPLNFLEVLRDDKNGRNLRKAIRSNDTAALFNRLIDEMSYQGIADRVAYGYIQAHGQVTWQQIDLALKRSPSCFKLSSYWAFNDCRYNKTRHTCSRPQHISACPLPRHNLRNGHLNQAAYSLFLFIRDLTDNKLVDWISAQILKFESSNSLQSRKQQVEALIAPLQQVYGISDKVLSVALSTLLLAAPKAWKHWNDAGCNMIAIDTLVHNFLHRTGILAQFGSEHVYGDRCYREGGCADIIRQISQLIDARAFNPSFPSVFPRFVQLAIWRYCSQSGRDICNGNRVDDRMPCGNRHCQLYPACDRVPLNGRSA